MSSWSSEEGGFKGRGKVQGFIRNSEQGFVDFRIKYAHFRQIIHDSPPPIISTRAGGLVKRKICYNIPVAAAAAAASSDDQPSLTTSSNVQGVAQISNGVSDLNLGCQSSLANPNPAAPDSSAPSSSSPNNY